jgi:lipopolysaccharide biosynthesis regulator YciM
LFKVLGQSETYRLLKEQKKRQKENQLDTVIKNFIERSNQKKPAEEWTEKVIRRVGQLGTDQNIVNYSIQTRDPSNSLENYKRVQKVVSFKESSPDISRSSRALRRSNSKKRSEDLD